MDIVINFIVLLLLSLLNIHWWIFVVLLFVVPLMTGIAKVSDYEDDLNVWAIVFPATLVAAYLFEKFVAKDLFGLQSIIAIGIMVFTVSEVTKTIGRKEKPDTATRLLKVFTTGCDQHT